MELFLVNTSTGLMPFNDDDYELKKQLKIGEVYKCSIKRGRSIKFHRKYFALIKCAWEYQNEKTRAFFKGNINLFRKTLEVSAGHCDMVYSIQKKEWIETPKSISFSSITREEFDNLYERVKDVIFSIFLKNISRDEFEKNLNNF